jgi:hypothetical protein
VRSARFLTLWLPPKQLSSIKEGPKALHYDVSTQILMLVFARRSDMPSQAGFNFAARFEVIREQRLAVLNTATRLGVSNLL